MERLSISYLDQFAIFPGVMKEPESNLACRYMAEILPIRRKINQSINQTINQSINQTVLPEQRRV